MSPDTGPNSFNNNTEIIIKNVQTQLWDLIKVAEFTFKQV